MNNENLIYLQSEADRLNIYMHSPKGKEDNFMKYCLRHFEDDYRDGGTHQNQDVWRFYELYSFNNNDGKLEADIPYAILNGGEWECALKVEGTPDFHGGIHGYEHQKSVFAKADGKDIELTKSYELWAEELEFVQYSEIYRQGTRDEVIATHVKHYIFKDGKVELHQELLWKQEVTILYSYMAMLPIKRTSDNTPEGEVISDRVMISNSDKVYDVGKIGHQTGISSVADHVRDVKHAKIWGESLGVYAEMSLDCEFLPTNNFFVQNTKEYNKFYFSYAGDGVGHTVKVGEKWELDSQYEIYRR